MVSSRLRRYTSIIVLFTTLGLLMYTFQKSIPDVKNLKDLRKQAGNWTLLGHQTALEIDPPPAERPVGALVIAAGADTDLKWTISAKVNWTVYEYDVRQPNNPDPQLRFPAAKGNEAMIYLSFIIDHYESLPWSIVFMHGHLEAWHQEDNAVRILGGLNRVALARQGYISLRCDWYPSCPAEMRPVHHDAVVWGPEGDTKGTEAAIAGNWRLLFPGEKLPETIASPCCAQFAVTRQAIAKRPKEDYERLRNWLMRSLLEDNLSGRVLEKLWAYLFTGEAVQWVVLISWL
ncbi:uncharacterized protein LTR77_010111 [Saxophila tyrrhenica]|uniref:Uncharacterized protein n=1 Tax=Saxophila tyrrhenica TaxID=1690608 RepID=A0AAV9NZQ9_9PEZI|nr:hypothetical protein LTR77_010111 [Saxophila tyrrhenica]